MTGKPECMVRRRIASEKIELLQVVEFSTVRKRSLPQVLRILIGTAGYNTPVIQKLLDVFSLTCRTTVVSVVQK
jgi:hypothetical protein